MKRLLKKLRTAALCAVCVAALTLPAWAAQSADVPEANGAAEAAQAVAPDASALPDNDALFYGYLLRQAGASDEASLLSNAGAKLNAKDKELYDRLKAFAATVADGERTSTVYTITYDDFQLTWTKAELGVSAILQVVNGQWEVTDECQAVIDAKLKECWGYDLEAVGDALLADCPYELYWYDKSYNPPISASSNAPYSANEERVTFSEAPSYTLKMAVSQDYQGADRYTVNRSLHAGIDNVVTKAKSIVSANASKSDYDKMLAYSTEICNLVKYNDYAAQNDPPYGDPWQLISVFDGDNNTDVVCEGYAKAFQYLCDLSAFSSPTVESRLVTGTLSGGTGAGPHMWNLVTMDNGKSYLVDVTNSDSNGGPEYLLLKGGSPDASNSRRYAFYGWITFVYDADTVQLWGDALLTLDTVDYKDASPTTPAAAPVQIRGCSLTLVDDIALNFALSFDDAVTSDSNAYVKLSGGAASDAQTLPIASATSGTASNIEGTVYYFTAHMPAKRMNDKITLACYDGNHTAYSMKTPAGDTVTEFSYCVQDYLNRAASETTLKSVAEAMSAYGYYAQSQFGYDAANAVAPSASYASKVAAMTADTLAAYAPTDTGSVSGVSAVGDNLTLESAIIQRCVFQLDGAVSDYVFQLDGKAVTPTAYPEGGAGAYCVEIPGVVAKDMDKNHTLTVTKGAETLTHQCNTLSYAYKALSDTSTSASLQSLVKAMYLYHQEAKAYFYVA